MILKEILWDFLNKKKMVVSHIESKLQIWDAYVNRYSCTSYSKILEERELTKKNKKLLDNLSDDEEEPKPTLPSLTLMMLKYSPEAVAKRAERAKKRQSD